MDHGIEINLNNESDFLKIVETLSRIGIMSSGNTVTQTCHILHKRGKYYILHFKELLKMDGVSKSEITPKDISRRNGIVKLLIEWNLCTSNVDMSPNSLSNIKIVSYKNKQNYVFKQNYTVGKVKRKKSAL
ncbi:MAG: translational repressor RegA [Candidatus Thiodiazotropha taylori]|uniref:Translational repressor RegA n=1 Tax=Candidatus Thiodiazotropha taylori TaxID=2792791 RepID=A0A9E4N258_9GAMM|nr:translational repressor RegA [Candidatus Thiodiazotropha taylori]MCW4255096.1 translational repressor RegA [Candidatus Thiodiazotropha taylori]